jgi:hypothetical protein
LRCLTSNPLTGLVEEGFAIMFDGIRRGTDVEYAVAVLGRKYGRPVVYRWLPHVWGPDPLKHASIVQAVLPTGAGMFGLKTEAQAHRIYNIET